MIASSHLFLMPPHMDASATRAQKWKPEPDAAASRNPLKSIQPPAPSSGLKRKPESPAPTPSKLPFWTPEKAGVPYVCQGTPVLFGPATVLSSVDVLLLELWEDSSFWTNNNVQTLARMSRVGYVVVTRTNRDDLPDGGIRHFAKMGLKSGILV